MRSIHTMLSVCVLAALAVGCSTNLQRDPYDGKSAADIYTDARAQMTRGRFMSAITHLDALEAHFPFGEYAEKAQLAVIYAHYRAEEYLSAAGAADRFIQLHPRHPHVDYAYYMRGLAHFQASSIGLDRYLPLDRSARDVGMSQQAFFDFATLVERFPQSQYTPNARQRMVYLRNLLANHTLAIAQYYYRRHAYLAAANRAISIIDDFDGTPAIPGALEVLAASYRALALSDLAATTTAIQTTNFPSAK